MGGISKQSDGGLTTQADSKQLATHGGAGQTKDVADRSKFIEIQILDDEHYEE